MDLGQRPACRRRRVAAAGVGAQDPASLAAAGTRKSSFGEQAAVVQARAAASIFIGKRQVCKQREE